MFSIILTTYKEPSTIGKAIESFINQNIKEKYEILAICPDKDTRDVILEYSKKYSQVKYIPTKVGKSVALNIAFKKAKGNILILSDGDVFVSKNSINELLKHFEDPKTGAVSGRPVSLNLRDNMFGYWSHLLINAGAHLTKLERKNKFILCSGCFYAIRNIVKNIPEDLLSEDAYISHLIWKKGYKIVYEPNAKVYAKYPDNFKDWINQKRRSAGGYLQIKKYFKKNPRMRSFSRELVFGWYKALSYPKSIKEFYWTISLFIARLYLWGLIFIDIKLKKKTINQLWKRVHSTK